MFDTIDRHLAREWLKSFGLTTGAILGLFHVQNLYDNLGDFLEHGAGAAEIFRYHLLVTPSLLSPVLPLSVLVATLLSYGALHKNQEITAMRSMGKGIWSLLRVNLFFASLLSVALFVLNNGGLSYSTESSRALYDELISKHGSKGSEDTSTLSHLTFENALEHRLWVMNAFNSTESKGRGVYLYQRDAEGQPIERLTARSVSFDSQSQSWKFQLGRQVFFDPEGLPLRFVDFEEKIITGLDTPKVLLASQKKVDDLSLRELQDLASKSNLGHGSESRRYGVLYHQSIAQPWNCVLALLIGVPFAVGGTRVNPMVGATKAIGIFVAFFLISGLCRFLGEEGSLAPFVAGWLPLVLLGAYAMFLIIRLS